MNKFCVTRQGSTFFQNKNDLDDEDQRQLYQIKRRSSLPQLISSANITQRLQVKNRLSKMTMKINELRDKGLKRMKMQKEDKDVKCILQEHYSNRKEYLKNKVPDLIKKTRDSLGNINSRVQRGKTYLDQLEKKFQMKFVFKVKNKHEED